MTTRRRKVETAPNDSGGLLVRGAGPRSLAPLSGLDHRLLPTGFERWRSELDMLSGMKLLNALTEPSNAAACIQTLPSEDLHRYLFEIGLEDAETVLALASSDQVRALLDFELWEKSDLSLGRLDIWLFALLRAGKDVLYQRILDLDDSLLSWVIKQNTYAYVIDDPDDFDPPLAEHILTPDRRLCIVFPRSVDHLEDLNPSIVKEPNEAPSNSESGVHGSLATGAQVDQPLNGGAKDQPVRIFLDLLMQEQPEFCIHLLLASTAALSSHIEEQAYRWRTARMADRGFVEYYEAREIYTPPPADWKRSLPPQRIDEETPPAKLWLAKVVATSERLDRAFAALSWEDALTVAELLGYIANMALSADRVSLWDQLRQEQTLRRLQAGITIALEVLNGSDASAEQDAQTLSRYHLNYLFRLGYQQMLDAARPLWRVEHTLRRSEDPTATLDELPRLKLWANALLGEHPEGRGEEGEVTMLRSLYDCKIAYEGALIIEDIVRIAQPLYAELLADIAGHDSADLSDSSTEHTDTQPEELRSGSIGMGPLIITAYWRDHCGAECHSSADQSSRRPRRLSPLSLAEVQELHQHCFMTQPEDIVQDVTATPKTLDGDSAKDKPTALALLKPEASQAISLWWKVQGGESKTAPLALLRELHEQMGGVMPEHLDPRFIPLIWWNPHGT